jgi:NodT family efflux transporter outer membrane factor (OMF) lipoprotein
MKPGLLKFFHHFIFFCHPCESRNLIGCIHPVPALAGMTALLFLSACAIGPNYHRPAANVPSTYKEAGNWKPAQPSDMAARGPWWAVYNDSALDGLEKQVAVSNQNLKASEAAYRQAASVVQEARASLFPTATFNAGAQRAGGGGQPTANKLSATLGASWEPDLWGRLARTVEGDVASAQASAADLAAATLSAQGTLAADYFELRAADQLQRLLDSTANDFARSLQITQNQYAAGVAAKGDVLQAQTQLDSTRAQAINVGVQRAQLEHAIAVLTGQPPASFTLAPAGDLATAPDIPPGLPSALLEQRPDIAAAERRMAAANAQIGVAMTAFFPDITLTASDGFVSAALGTLLRASSNVWAVGPQLALTVFDAGARSARVREARAVYDQQTALYRQTVLTAFQQVEDQLSTLRILAQQADVQEQAVRSARQAEVIVLNQYKAGTVAYTSVITAQNSVLSSEQGALSVRENRLTASVQLIEALGGGWDESVALLAAPGIPPKK